MRMRLYRVYIDDHHSSWEVTASSSQSAIYDIRKFYPETQAFDLRVEEITVLGEPVTKLNQLRYGEMFQRVIRLANEQYATIGPPLVRGDFDQSRDQYRCLNHRGTYEYVQPYETITICKGD